MPSKKKKFNARFPPARIKKIMQTDEDVGKVAAAVPVIISRALELFIQSLILKASETTKAKHAKTLSSSHIKHTIQSEKQFDFLKDLVASIPDVAPAEEEGLEPSASSSVQEGVVSTPTARPRGRPRKKPVEGEDSPNIPKKRGRKPKVIAQPAASAASAAQPAASAAQPAAEPEPMASSENDSTDSGSEDEDDHLPGNNFPYPLATHYPSATVSTPATLHQAELPGHTNPVSSSAQSLQINTAAAAAVPTPPPTVAIPALSSTAPPPCTISASSTIAPTTQITFPTSNSTAPAKAAIPAPNSISPAHVTQQNSLPHPVPYSPMPMNLSAAASSHVPHPAFYHSASSYQTNMSGVLDLSKGSQPLSDAAVTTSVQPPMYAMPPLGGRIPPYIAPMMPGYSQHMGLPPMLSRPPLISSMVPAKPSGTPGELPPSGFPPHFAGYAQRPHHHSASEDYDS